MHPDLRHCSYTEVLVRVSYRIIVRDYHDQPENYAEPVPAVVALAIELKEAGWANLYHTIMGASLWLLDGYALREWRDLPAYGTEARKAINRRGRRF